MLDLTLGPSLKVKQWFTGFGELSFRWIQICIGLRCVSLVCFRLSFLTAAAAALWSPLNISLIISPDESRGYIGFRSVAPPPPPP